jgi:Protein of unknown function (DUF3768)
MKANGVALDNRSAKIRTINDRCRKHFMGCIVSLTPSVLELDEPKRRELLTAVQDFEQFDSGNDPYHEHDFGCVEMFGEKWFFKMDYYSPDMRTGSDDPSNVHETRRVLTIMHCQDY